jgi:hypothetical protein
MQQHITMLVSAHGYFFERRVGNGLQGLFQLGNDSLFLDLGRGQNLFESGDFLRFILAENRFLIVAQFCAG